MAIFKTNQERWNVVVKLFYEIIQLGPRSKYGVARKHYKCHVRWLNILPVYEDDNTYTELPTKNETTKTIIKKLYCQIGPGDFFYIMKPMEGRG